MIATPDITELVARHYGTAERVANKFARRLPAGVTRDDLVAECWSAIWRAAERCNGGRNLEGEFAPYAFVAAVYEARKFCRRMGRRGIKGAPQTLRLVVVNETPAGDDGPELADLVADREHAGEGGFIRPFAWWQSKLACLTPELRRVVVARVLRGELFQNIAVTEGVGAEQIARRWEQAVAALKVAHPDLETELRS